MGFKASIQAVFRRLLGVNETSEPELKKPEKAPITEEKEEIEEIHSIWDFLTLKENTQAAHLTQVIGFDEWVDMEEIRRRILELFGIQYKNERSLYPHLKTLSDLGLFETTDVGGKRKWRKKDLLLKIKKKKEKEKSKEKAEAESRSKSNESQSGN